MQLDDDRRRRARHRRTKRLSVEVRRLDELDPVLAGKLA
jgi:hypothetical protein